MGLFSTLFSSKPAMNQAEVYTPHSDHEAWIAILYACMSVDGEVSDVEINAIANLLMSKNKFTGIDIVAHYKKAAHAKMLVGFFSLVESSAQLIKDDEKPTLLALAAELVLADGIITEKEKELIEFIAKQLNIEESQALKIIEVMLIKNRDNRILG